MEASSTANSSRAPSLAKALYTIQRLPHMALPTITFINTPTRATYRIRRLYEVINVIAYDRLIRFLNMVKAGTGNGFVKPSAAISTVGTHCRRISPSLTWFQIQWYRTSICLL